MRKKILTGIFLGCLAFVPPALSQDNGKPPGPDTTLVTKAEQGDTGAQFKLGEFYFSKGNNADGLKWMLKSAEAGNADAQSSLGYRYENGNGVPEDVTEARKWYRKAAGQGNGNAQANLCSHFASSLKIREGKVNDPSTPVIPINGPKEEVEEAIKWCGESAQRGDRVSQNNLGILYAKGTAELKPDYKEAYFWLSVQKKPPVLRDKIADKLTPEERAEIEQRAKDWKPDPHRPAPPR